MRIVIFSLRVTVWHHKALPNDARQWSRGTVFYPHQKSHDGFFFLITFWSPAFDFKVEVAFNESNFYTLTSAILKSEVAMTSAPNVLTTELRDVLYNRCIDIKVGRCSHLNEYMGALWVPKVKVIHGPWSKYLRFDIVKTFFSLNNH